MSMLPEAKLDILLAHHASLEAQILGQLNSEDYVRITRELAELNPLIDAVKTYRAARGELAFGTVDTFLLWRLTNGAVHATDATNASRTLMFVAAVRPCRGDHQVRAQEQYQCVRGTDRPVEVSG